MLGGNRRRLCIVAAVRLRQRQVQLGLVGLRGEGREGSKLGKVSVGMFLLDKCGNVEKKLMSVTEFQI